MEKCCESILGKKEVNTRDPDHILLVLKVGFYWEKLYNILSSNLNSCTTDAKPAPSGYPKAWIWCPGECVPVVEMVDSVPRGWQLDASLLFPQEKEQDPWECTQAVYSIAVLHENASGRAVEGLTEFHLTFALAWIHFPKGDEECYPWHHVVRPVAGHAWKSHIYHLASGEHLPRFPFNTKREKSYSTMYETLWNQRVFSRVFQWENESTNDLIRTGGTTSSSLCFVRQRCDEKAREPGSEEAAIVWLKFSS